MIPDCVIIDCNQPISPLINSDIYKMVQQKLFWYVPYRSSNTLNLSDLFINPPKRRSILVLNNIDVLFDSHNEWQIESMITSLMIDVVQRQKYILQINAYDTKNAQTILKFNGGHKITEL